jgi:hypothetical protein
MTQEQVKVRTRGKAEEAEPAQQTLAAAAGRKTQSAVRRSARERQEEMPVLQRQRALAGRKAY